MEEVREGGDGRAQCGGGGERVGVKEKKGARVDMGGEDKSGGQQW